MAQLEKLIQMAENELTEYSTDARKIEKLRRKFAFMLNPRQQQQIKDELLAQMPQGFFGKMVLENRQTVALPFWGIAGLGLLFGISLQQPLDFLAPAIALPAAIQIQRWGWQLEAKRLVLQTLDDLEARAKNPTAS
ncbi:MULTISPECIES: hypothetical protein [Cyanophyceae]|uniref:hypothetical protein n=1 Tax=Cyanophyceae TaxID=3028117 RepID=UPI00016DC92C|nr:MULTISPECIES: hypothetical protein [Cyanophyceae]ACA99520.1 conserved hypothetical protein [Picosynechococcus sp. PCC 7002]AMA09235.1 hypothetical protein AWQ23_07855 [Picosynechococcus sp. PCC 73109]ANV90528.1 hypothetical protein AWQ24_07755 [Picosynechococcus sp. PCC 8807]SMH30193.1 hypothetical protein SAMN06272755_0167 [Picosynechococcus sp. OG1]SMQ83840.1 hypothetical protein SAMN06272774_2543 [Synechococcus sp. 7002]